MNLYRRLFKRTLDVVVSATGIIISVPFIFCSAIMIKAENRIPGIFFYQSRPGKNGKIFKIWKIKTMTEERDASGNLLPDEQRLTPVGKLIRSLSLDELPQLWNVLKGDMSLIGPRPLLVEYLPLYSAEQSRRHDVRPGITGWAQCNGRNQLTWRKKFEYDVWYVNNLSFLTDCKVIAKTISKVIKRDGISAEGSATAEKFNGNN